MIQQKYVKNLQIGDTIAVAESGNFFSVGFFAGEGRGTIQYYIPRHINWLAEAEAKGRKVTMIKSYVQQTSQWRMIKLHPDFVQCADKDDQVEYDKASERLIEKGIIKQ